MLLNHERQLYAQNEESNAPRPSSVGALSQQLQVNVLRIGYNTEEVRARALPGPSSGGSHERPFVRLAGLGVKIKRMGLHAAGEEELLQARSCAPIRIGSALQPPLASKIHDWYMLAAL